MQQSRLGIGQIDSRDTDLGESEALRPGSQLLQQRLWVDVKTAVMTLPHRPILETRHLSWPDEAHCAADAQRLAAVPALRDARIELQGPLGAGKTTFARHLLRALGVQGRIKSPTYALMEPYEVDGQAVSHFDFYRFEDPHEWDEAGLRDVFAAPGLKLSEWPDKVGELLPAPDLRLAIEPLRDEARRVCALAFSDRGRALLAAFPARVTA
jgi:tRNA threonylcarbamoyladenosine biosynthesis protein TsaE